MARKINGPFGDISIATVGQLGSTPTNLDIFTHMLSSQMAQYDHTFSSTQSNKMIEKIKEASKGHQGSESTREDSKNRPDSRYLLY